MILDDLLKTTSQDCADFIQDDRQAPVVAYDTAQVMESFLTSYFLPWENPFLSFSPEELCKKEKNRLEKCSQNPGFGLNKHRHATEFITAISNNMALATFPNHQQPAIVVRTTNLRGFPCVNLSFSSPGPGQGYPFDNWQESLLTSNEPVYVLHTSQDKAWNFVVTGGHICGWVQRSDIAYTTPAFISQWKTGKYVTPLCDNVLVAGNIFNPLARVGQLMPLAHEQNGGENYQVLTAATDPDGFAMIQVNTVGKEDTAVMPLLATPDNMVRLANSLMGQPYGWGGAEGYRDCSSLLKDLFVPFGIWMPRDSGPQSKAGTFVSLEGLENDQKEKVIREQGIPFFSLIWMPGHITLYVGAKEGKTYVYHNVWGLRTHSVTGEEGRAILGKTVIMPLDFGKEYSNIEKMLLDKAKGLILLKDRLVNPHEELELFKK